MSDRKVVLVTGCAKGGIGYEYCKAFADHNCQVFASDIPSRLHDLSGLEDYSADVAKLELDVTCNKSATSAVESVVSKCGRIDILVNNAGVGSLGPLSELSLDSIRRAWEINALGQLRLIQKVVPHMAGQGSGTIVNIGSVVGKVATPWAGSYCASKAAVHAFSNTLRVELRPFGIDVVLVVPGSIRSNFGSESLQTRQQWKLYKGFTEAIEERGRASQGGKATDSAIFARHVVKKVLSSKPPKQIAFGHMAGLFAVLSWSPLWVRDMFFSHRLGLNKKV